ncbi:ABC transporter ATP-binding protein [Paenibacillus macerans]|uniref:ABC-type transporter ATP-binding protein EcsA n=1 Tax=Paenibacillus macerans TaxID=44252 RepID=A0A090ZJP0_PAEMA|nr:ABC transporter ATP-binding protein [Paenibacillus macerans]KFN10578.1 ABC-type transporter ATP-binding protein EcsA [Paenibacillus macerans]MEC0140580.1 ABC transporter ATP-binding protein [Paenibacillus macerans]MEC0155275.1 ABC transporter ATP-binding protein [Paenibacillus macerans]MED4959400.1 ABC transporter ATP-binding protein [Paenibacillus macerans]MUG22107.1 ATP-binding cassette domain-containing protein [Paenibacillus macerans]
MSEMPVLQVEELSGGYSLGRPVLHDVSFEVGPGEMVGLIGLNGAGKSTTMKHILGLMAPHRGGIYVTGKTREEAPEAYQSSLAFVPESPLLYEELTVREHLEFTARAYGVGPEDYQDRAERLLKLFRMEEKADSLSMHLSKGMKQKVMIMCAFVARPPLYIIDEPFLGLDPLGIRSLLDFMLEMKESGSSILLSSHILSTIENYCDRFIVLHRGKVIAQGTLAEIGEQAQMPGAALESIFYALVKDGA